MLCSTSVSIVALSGVTIPAGAFAIAARTVSPGLKITAFASVYVKVKMKFYR
jgi:hypothetical protein